MVLPTLPGGALIPPTCPGCGADQIQAGYACGGLYYPLAGSTRWGGECGKGKASHAPTYASDTPAGVNLDLPRAEIQAAFVRMACPASSDVDAVTAAAAMEADVQSLRQKAVAYMAAINASNSPLLREKFQGVVRSICNELLDVAECEGDGGCPLCRS